MDADAKRYWVAKVDEDQPIQQNVSGEPWSLWHGNIKLCNELSRQPYKTGSTAQHV